MLAHCRPFVLPLAVGLVLVSAGCGDRFGTSGNGGAGGVTSQGPGGGTSTGDPVGCADGKRELYRDEDAAPDIAGCAGAFDVPGVTTMASRTPSCDRGAGDDGDNRQGIGCSVADLCAEGWHVCSAVEEVRQPCPGDANEPSFFVSRVSTTMGSRACASGTNDNLVGCGMSVGQPPDPAESCGHLDTVLIFSQCETELEAWSCGTASDLEAEVVVKSGEKEGGALCCRD